MIFAIDGTAGSGKSTLAKLLAEKMGFVYFDTGAMYRAITWLALEKKVDVFSEEEVDDLKKEFSSDVQTDLVQNKKYFVSGKDVTLLIRTPEVTDKVSEMSSIPAIRKAMVPIQRAFAIKKNVIFEGRDMGTVVFPEAKIKFFFVASSQVRATRRLKELKEKFPNTTQSFQEVLSRIEDRDEIDSTRKISPLKCADDAIYIDTSNLSISQVLKKILKIVKKKTKKRFFFFYKLVVGLFHIFFVIFY